MNSDGFVNQLTKIARRNQGSCNSKIMNDEFRRKSSHPNQSMSGSGSAGGIGAAQKSSGSGSGNGSG
eukprot:CAMPEP_0168608490 /NCGR_PEP_ID=MMETSP0449_2-20121227/654_1 /TAXON_ID=1082188 /ORGANISM="Strombidium rassoulzadegani, Strain ras09" /LENGTH=66 /DNA_ID=CAMNT_0008648477 /DNA_START=55 /DNA_END=255 /DNA_ORIENTATION=-